MKFSGSSAVFATAALLPSALAQQTTSTCSSVHIFLAKGNNEPYPGRQEKLVASICGQIDDCDYEDIQMQNMLEDDYCRAVEQGATNGAAQIKAYNKKCPDTKLVVSGYSQGGQIVGDILGGGGGVFFNDCVQKPNPPLERSSDAGQMIVAAMIFGDTRHTASQSYNYLSGASKDGLFPRPGDQLAGLNDYASVLRNWCPDTDPICAQGDVVDTHLNYFDIYSDEAGAWVKSKVDAAADGEASSSRSASATSTRAEETSTSEVETTTEAETSTTVGMTETTEAAESSTTEESEESTSTETAETTESTFESSPSKEASTTAEETTSDSGDSQSNADETTTSGSAAETGDNDDAAGSLVPSLGLMAMGMLVVLGM